MLLLQFLKKYASFTLNLNLRVEAPGRTVVFFGQSGSGKTLTMQCIAGLVTPDQGRIEVDGQVLFDSAQKINIEAQKRHIGYMVQDYALFPHLDILQNVAYAKSGLLGRYLGQRQKKEAVKLLKKFGIAHLAQCYPGQISGGQKQRVAMARALNAQPDLLLLDEPFSALDPLLRQNMRIELKRFLEELKLSVVLITHDPEDVEAFGGSLILFRRGEAKLVGEWRELRAKYPSADACLRDFMRSENFLKIPDIP